MNLLILDISYKSKSSTFSSFVTGFRPQHNVLMGHPAEFVFRYVTSFLRLLSCFPQSPHLEGSVPPLHFYSMQDIYCSFHTHLLCNSITFLHLSLLHYKAGYQTVCTATVTQGFIHSRALTSTMITDLCDECPATSQDSEASKGVKALQKLTVYCTPRLKVFRCWNARWKKPSGTFVVWEKNDKHSQDDPWDCLCSTMLISAVVTHGP